MQVLDVEELRLEDLPELAPTVSSPKIQTLRAGHHFLARVLSTGVKHQEAALITGFSESRISVLLADPTFQELVAFYAERQEELFTNVYEKLAALSTDTLTELHERLMDNPERFKVKELVELARLALDRTGHGPTSTVKTENLYLTAKDVLELKRQAKEAQTGIVTPKDSFGAADGHVIDLEPLAEGSAEGSPSERDDLSAESRTGTLPARAAG